MKVKYAVQNLTFEFDFGEDYKQLFKILSSLDENFGDLEKCPNCGNKDLKFVVRIVKDGSDFYEVWCKNLKCKARKKFGVHRDKPTFFPKGWTRWTGTEEVSVG